MEKVETSREVIKRGVKRIHCIDHFGGRTKSWSMLMLIANVGVPRLAGQEAAVVRGSNQRNFDPLEISPEFCG